MDLKTFNVFLVRSKFCMELAKIVIASLLPGDFLASVDIQDAYLHIPFFHPHQRFAVGDQHCQIFALPLGLSTVPPGFHHDACPGPSSASSSGNIYYSLLGQSLTKELTFSVSECPVDSVDPAKIWLDPQTLKVTTGPYQLEYLVLTLDIACPGSSCSRTNFYLFVLPSILACMRAILILELRKPFS